MAEQLILDLAREPSLAAADFLPSDANREALSWLARWPDWPGPVLVLHGPPGSGKSHLARVFAERTGAIHLQRESLPAGDGLGPERRPLVLDPATPVVDEERLFHLLDGLRGEGRHLLMTAGAPPSEWPLRLPDLASRVRAAPAVGLGLPDDAFLGALLVKLFADRQLQVEPEVITFLVQRIERSYGAAARVVEALDSLSLRAGRRVTRPMARALLTPGGEETDRRRDEDGSRDHG